jgi:hypothetical protein
MAMSKSSPIRILAAKKRRRATELRLKGLTWPEVSEIMTKEFPESSLGPQNCYRLVMTEVNYWNQKRSENVSQLTRTELARLDKLQASIWDEAVAGNIKAVEAVAKIMDRRAKLLGLTAPDKVEVGGFILGGLSDEEVEEEARRLGIQVGGTDAEAANQGRQAGGPADGAVPVSDGGPD